MYRLEIIDNEEYLIDGWTFNNMQDLMIEYNKIKKDVKNYGILKGDTVQVFAGQYYENMTELTQYRLNF